jgi:Amt family ammonium transporter
MGYSFIGTLIIALLIKYTIGLRISEEAEVQGIDQAEHAETAYEFTPVSSTGGGHVSSMSPAPQRVVT